MNPAATPVRSRAYAWRTLLYFAVWWVVAGVDDLATALVGVFTAFAAARLSLRLLPAGPGRLRSGALAVMAGRFLKQSIVAGVDVARRAFSPSLPLRPGYVVHPFETPPGDARNLFTTITCLMPGSLPTGADAHGSVLYHCLDVERPVAAELADEERRLLNGRSCVASGNRGPPACHPAALRCAPAASHRRRAHR